MSQPAESLFEPNMIVTNPDLLGAQFLKSALYKDIGSHLIAMQQIIAPVPVAMTEPVLGAYDNLTAFFTQREDLEVEYDSATDDDVSHNETILALISEMRHLQSRRGERDKTIYLRDQIRYRSFGIFLSRLALWQIEHVTRSVNEIPAAS